MVSHGTAITPSVVMTLEVRQEKDYWFGQCIELGTATDGPTAEAVFEKLSELVILTLHALDDAGQRERVFRERNIPIYFGIPDVLPTQVRVSRPESNVAVRLQALPVRSAEQSDASLVTSGV